MSLRHPTLKSFGYALNGLREALVNEPNFRVHCIIATVVLIFAVALGLTLTQMAILVLTIGFVLLLELVNTSLEKVTDIISPQIKKEAKIAKDVAAASVLVSAIIAVIVGIILFLPQIKLLTEIIKR